MFEIKMLTLRNVKVYLRDKVAVFFSFLSVIILLGLYLLFLKNIYKVDFLNGILSDPEQAFMIDALMMSGVLVINTMTLALGNLGTMVSDFERAKIDSFIVTPVKKYKIVVSYFLASFIITSIFTLLMWFLALGMMGLTTGLYFSKLIVLKVSFLLLYYTLISTSFMILLATFIKSMSAFGAISGVLGTIIGFTSGIYIPLNQLPESIIKFSSLIPFTHMSIFMKTILLKPSFDKLEKVAPLEMIEGIKEGFTMNPMPVVNLDLSFPVLMAIFFALALLSLSLASIRLSKKINH